MDKTIGITIILLIAALFQFAGCQSVTSESETDQNDRYSEPDLEQSSGNISNPGAWKLNTWTRVTTKYDNITLPDIGGYTKYYKAFWTGEYYIQGVYDTSFKILKIDLNTGEVQVTDLDYISSIDLAYSESTQEIISRSGNNIRKYDLKTMEINSKVTLSHPFQDICVHQEKLIGRDPDEGIVYVLDLHTLEIEKSFSIESTPQIIFPYQDNTVLFCSSYTGSIVNVFNIETGEFSEKHIFLPEYQTLKSAFLLEKGLLGYYYPETGEFGLVKNLDTIWHPVTETTGEIANKSAMRSVYYKRTLTGAVTVRVAKEVDEGVYLKVLIPFAESPYYKIVQETLIDGSELLSDDLGNRYMLIPLAQAGPGEIIEFQFYDATLDNYAINYDLSKYPDLNINDLDTSAVSSEYLENHAYLDFNSPVVTDKLNEVINGSANYNDVLNSIHIFIRSPESKGVEDGITSAAIAIENGHYGCNERSRIEMAFLRKIGIPARWLVVNYPGDGEDAIHNHYFHESWHPNFGWIPMETLISSHHKPGFLKGAYIMYGVESLTTKAPKIEFFQKKNSEAGELKDLGEIELQWITTKL